MTVARLSKGKESECMIVQRFKDDTEVNEGRRERVYGYILGEISGDFGLRQKLYCASVAVPNDVTLHLVPGV
jgi:hypothetical protein